MEYDQEDFEIFGPAELPRDGEIITFYSFKGGVGRTMALANTAFLAACNGKRVLVMDWDLEAPGLAYYFRGVQEPSVARELRSSPGVLNFLWDWVNRVRNNTQEAIEEAVVLFDSGAPFNDCVRELVASEFFRGSDGSIDYIGAGSPRIEAPESTHYEEALASFPWPDFFSKMAGGYVSRALRDWAKKRYDLILIDSRTGLAESAGVCTMQLPDAVALCFVLNRQNIEGISKIASVIRATKPEINLLAAPMRVAREGTSEESEARAKAITDLTRLGGFSVEMAIHQLQALAIKHADAVPFYETLAPVVASDMEVDALCLNYLRFARELTGLSDLALIPLDESLVSRARARLQPQLATSEYIEKLIGSEPLRAITELESLISSAEELVANGEHESLAEDYLQALISVSFEARNIQFSERSLGLQARAINILRMLTEVDTKWSKSLVHALELHLIANSGQLEPEDEITLREELDALYEPTAQPAAEIKRLENRRRIAWLSYRVYDSVAVQAVSDLFSRVSELRSAESLGTTANEDLLFIEADLLYLKARLSLREGDTAEGLEYLMRATEICEEVDWDTSRVDLKRTIADAHALLATHSDLGLSIEQRQAHAAEVARINGAGLSPAMFYELFSLVLKQGSGAAVLQFLDATLGSQHSQPRTSSLAFHLGRNSRNTVTFLQAAINAVGLLEGDESPQTRIVLQRLAAIADATVSQPLRRPSFLFQGRPGEIVQRYNELLHVLHRAGVEWTPNSEVQQALSTLLNARSDSVPPRAKQ
ncbi:KGGVGR-motif variant AAA ATPase [Cupriavidus pauculus]|nr:hypothetical protein [Cupriavidus pauculus]